MDSKLYLAENVLNERHTVTYRSLSRSLKVHANRAKQILYEFHRTENAKRPQSVHATYVISGVQKPTPPPATNGHTNDEDEVMQSSPYLPSSMPNQEAASDVVSIASILLVREEDLEDAKATFESVKTIHVYSVQAAPLQDLNTLTTVYRELALASTQDDPLECGSQWGMIQNRHVKRRSGTRAPPAAKTATTAKPESTVPAKRSLPTKEPAVRQENKPDESQPTSDSQSSVKSSSKSAAPKKGKSSLFSSFAKTKPPKPKQADSATQSGADDVMPDDASEDDAEELFPESGDKAPSTNRETKKEREEKLKKMMEEEDADDEEMADADEEPQREPTPEEQPPPPPPPSKAAELKEEVTVHGGRRRGRRQVIKKKTVKDEEGYLVTREEATWESFSEDEPAPPKKKPAVNVAKAKGKPTGQGNIMSFFGKK